MEDGLLCYFFSIKILRYINSLGHLTTFPQQIFKCKELLEIDQVYLKAHDIAFLPAHAFGSAAKELRYISLDNIGLEFIHEDAFTELISIQFVYLIGNKLSKMSDTVLLPFSTNLRKVQITDTWYSGVLNLTAMGVPRYSNIKLFDWRGNYVSDVTGNLCSNHTQSELEIAAFMDNMNRIEMLPPDIFDNCVSLKYLSIEYNGLVHLPERLFATNVTQLETLLLMGNRLNSNISWSDVLLPLHELKYLNPSTNMLTFWSYNLSSLWKLKLLDISHNAIMEILHMAFMNMTMLKFLLLEDNSLAFVTNEVQNIFTRVALVHLGSNSISQLNISEDIVTCDSSILNVSANSLIHLNLPLSTDCTQYHCLEMKPFYHDSFYHVLARSSLLRSVWRITS